MKDGTHLCQSSVERNFVVDPGVVCGIEDRGPRTLRVGGLDTLDLKTTNILYITDVETISSDLPDAVVRCPLLCISSVVCV